MKISIVGWYGMSNVGDEAFRVVFSDLFSEHEIEFVRPPEVCHSPDIVILGGGSVASPFYTKILPDCPRYALGIDIAYKSEIDLLAKMDFKGIYIRNNTDVAEMREKLACPVNNTPDLAFLLQPSGCNILGKYKKFPNKRTIGVLVTDYVSPAIDRSITQFRTRADSFITTMANQLDILSEQGYEIILIPCSTGGYGDDRRINLDICAFMKNRPTLIFDTLCPQDMIDLIDQIDITICQRFHAHVFSIIAGTPFVSIDFTRKVELLMRENSLPSVSCARFQGNQFNADGLIETLQKTLTETDSDELLKVAHVHRQRLLGIMQQVKQDWLR